MLVPGNKIKRPEWDDSYIHFKDGWLVCNLDGCYCSSLDSPTHWQKYTEPKKPKVIKLYRYTCEDATGWTYQTNWINGKPSDKILKVEEKEIEVEG